MCFALCAVRDTFRSFNWYIFPVNYILLYIFYISKYQFNISNFASDNTLIFVTLTSIFYLILNRARSSFFDARYN